MGQLDYYSTQGIISDPKSNKKLFENLPTSISDLCEIVHGVIIHRDATKFYGFELPEERKIETETRYINEILTKIIALDENPLTIKRIPEKRFAGTCRDFALLFCSILRYQNIPARLRCGFAGYFNDMWDDHWICEYWDKDKNKWILVDPEIDDVEYKAYNLKINPLDIPASKFLTAGAAWIGCRNGTLDATTFGVSTIDIQGLWFVRANVVRDVAAVNKVEMLPWDYWGIADKDFETFTDDDFQLIDKIALLTNKSISLEEIQKNYGDNALLHVPKKIHSYATFAGEQIVTLRD